MDNLEKMMQQILAQLKTNQGKVEANMKSNQEKLGANQERRKKEKPGYNG
jgi:hypothetical protein